MKLKITAVLQHVTYASITPETAGELAKYSDS